ncbi:hypothetical protein SAMN05216326_10988 [Nitrosomonas marina]|uniref:Lipocalin-like domain-containing protein n=1 Tax=Nitrosomonas marina TaxID=917 RepID=A0A1I0B6F8_9PROT|nr:hypothetical protein [Nitrosomonas marina]SET02366.1 hypothetical protein SAMN05216326_10988 [Nitrosomonas marina]
MKKFLLMLIMAGLSGCETVPDKYQQSHTDNRLVGTWTGEYVEQDGSVRSWTQTRKVDGTYSIEFLFMEPDGTIERQTETGRWWTQDELFHEITPPGMKQPDSYQYRFKDNRCIEFLLVASDDASEEIGQYRFVECLSNKVPLAALIN